jgi:hypothetical protein
MCGGTCPETGAAAFNVFKSILIDDADPPSPIQGPDPPTAPPPGTPIPPGPAPSLPLPQPGTSIVSSQTFLQTLISSTTSSSFEGNTIPTTGSAVTFYTSISTLYPFSSDPPSVLPSTPSSNPTTFGVPSASLPTFPVSRVPEGTPSFTFVRSGPSETAGVDEPFPIPAQVTGSKSSRYDVSISIFLILGEALLAVAIMA